MPYANDLFTQTIITFAQRKMKLNFIVIHVAIVAADERSGCYWPTTNDSRMVSCMSGYYIKGACESYKHNECKLNTGLQMALNGIKCCPVTDELNFDNRSNCIMIGQNRSVLP